MIKHANPKERSPLTRSTNPPLAKMQQDHVAAHHLLSRRGLWGLLLFLLVSLGAVHLRAFDLMASLPENVRELLGYPPPPEWVGTALAVYTLSVLILLLTRLGSNSLPAQRWSHLGYRTVFYLFYMASNSLSENYLAVFTAGVMLYLLEQLSIWVSISRKGRQAEDSCESEGGI